MQHQVCISICFDLLENSTLLNLVLIFQMPTVLFTLELRIGSQVRDVEILQNDTIQTLARRLAYEKGISESKVERLQQRLVQSLIKISDSRQTKPHLKQKIHRFINPSLLSQSNCSELNTQEDSEDQQQSQGQQLQILVKDWVEDRRPSKSQFSKRIRLQTEPSAREFKENNIICSENQELQQAYRVILTKCKKPGITTLVEQALKQLRLNAIRKQNQRMQTVVTPPSKQDRFHTQSNSSVKYPYSHLRKSLYVLKGGSSNRFYQYSTNLQSRSSNTPHPPQYAQSSKESQGRKYNYLKSQC